MAEPLKKQEKRIGRNGVAGISIIIGLIILTAITFAGNPAFPSTEGDHFPRPAELEPSIEFWKKVYTVYTTEEGIIHDSDDLTIIYEVTNLAGIPDINSLRNKRIKSVKEKYRNILGSIIRKRGVNLNKEEERVFNLFSDKSMKRLTEAQYSIRFQLGQKDRFIQGIQLSYRYLAYMKEIIADMDLPEKLIYLPHVESSFNYMAFSKFGAAGIWQFTRDTGRRYLKINNAIDERLDPIKSTHAALKHLQDNYNKIQSWPLAIIAYNYGLAGMRRAVEGLDTTDVVEIICRHKGRTFGFASRNFYCEFLAACEIAENYREHFGEIDIEEPLQFQAYRLKEDVLLKDILKYTGLEKGVIKKYNPAIRRPAILSQRHLPKGFDLKLPNDRDYQLDTFFMDYRAPKPVQVASLDKSTLKKSVTQREPVIPREPIALDKALITDEDVFSIKSAIARAILNVSLPSFTPLEDVIRSRSKPIMASASPIIPLHAVIPEKSLMASKPLNVPLPAVIPSESMIASGSLNAAVLGVIPNGAIILSEPLIENKPIIASGSVILDESMIASESVITHESLLDIPLPFIEEPPISQAIGAGKQRYYDLVKVDKQFVWLRVIPNETIGHYASWGRTGSWEIRRLNGMAKSRSHVKIGSIIRIRLNNVTPEEFQNARADYHRGIEKDFFNNYQVEDVYEYEIKRGDNIWALCMRVFYVPQWLIEWYNSTIDLDNLVPGTWIAVPNVVEKPKGLENGFNGNLIRATSIAGW